MQEIQNYVKLMSKRNKYTQQPGNYTHVHKLRIIQNHTEIEL